MRYGSLDFLPALTNLELLAAPTTQAVLTHEQNEVYVAPIDSNLADTAAFCEAYNIGLDVSANCVIVTAKNGTKKWYAACILLATDKIDVNGAVRSILDAKKVSFARMDDAVTESGMEYGGITPIGLPPEWPILLDEKIVTLPHVIIGSGIRGSKLLVSGNTLASLTSVQIVAIAKK